MPKKWGQPKWKPESAKETNEQAAVESKPEPTIAQLVATLDRHGIRVQPE